MKKLVIQDSINKQKQFNRKQVLTPENRETTQPSNTQQNNTERIQTQEQTVNLEKIKENYKRGKDFHTITKKYRMESSVDRNGTKIRY